MSAAESEHLRTCRGDARAREFFRLKGELDPDGVLDNDFLARNFGIPPEASGPAAD